MQGNKKPAQLKHAGRLTRAAESIVQFFTRALTPVNNPLTVAPEVPELPKDTLAPKGRRKSFSGELFAELLSESLMIGGWVAMWRPMEIFLYRWWPIVRHRRTYMRLAEMAVTVIT